MMELCLNQGFNVSLPLAFQLMKSGKPDAHNQVALGEPDLKRKRPERDVASTRVMNSDQAEEFKMNPGKSWKATWAGQLNGDKPF